MNRIMRNSLAYVTIGFIALSACANKKAATTEPTENEKQEVVILEVVDPIEIDKDKSACEQPWGNDEVSGANKQQFGYMQSNYGSKDYAEALKNWRHLVKNTPCAHINIYKIGEALLKSSIKKETDSTKRAALVEEFNLNFTNRIQYFGQEMKQRERWGKLLYTLDSTQYEIIDDNIGRMVARDGDTTESNIMIYYLNNTFRAFNAGKVDNDEMFEKYGRLSDIVEHNLDISDPETDSAEYVRWAGLQTSLDEIISKVGTCEDLFKQFKPNLAEHSTDKEWLNKAEKALRAKKCTKDGFYIDVLNKLYAVDPSIDVAQRLARYYYKSGNVTEGNKRTIDLIKMDAGNNSKNSERYTTLAKRALNAGASSTARNYADKALALNSRNGEAILAKGTALYKIARACGDAFDKQAASWIMMEYAVKAKSVDSRVTAKANRYYNRYSAYTPTKSDIFMRNIKPGARYTIKCAGITTTVR